MNPASANAYLKAKRAPEAIDEYSRILKLIALFAYNPASCLAQLGPARAYLRASDSG